MFDLGQLRLLQAADRTGSYLAAGRELGFTQPAVTYQMRGLGRRVGAPIAVRVGRAMRLTAAGKAAAPPSSPRRSPRCRLRRPRSRSVSSRPSHPAPASSCEAGKPTVMGVADDYVAMQALVGHGLGVALIPDLALTAHRDERTVARSLRGWPQRVVEVEVWPDLLRVHAVSAPVGLLQGTPVATQPVRR